MSLETNLKRKIWLRNFRYNGNYRTFILYIIIVLIVSITIYGYHYTQNSIIEELETLNELDESNRIAARFVQRREHVKETCSKFELDKPGSDRLHLLNAWEFLINDKYKLIYCNVFKAASSSWLYNFNLLAGYSVEHLEKTKKTPVALAREKYPRPTAKKLKMSLDKYLSFLIVRHPFERLVSAYVNKFIKNIHMPYFVKISKKIIKASRTQWRELNGKNISHLSPEIKHKIEALAKGDDELPPTFEEFIRFIICEKRSRHKLDEHWTPITPFCSPCLADFNIIMKFETLEEDQNYLIELAKLGDIIKPQWKNPTNKDHKNISSEYFSQLSVNQLEHLISLYKYDFEIFQYSTDPYYKFVDANTTNLPCFTLDYKYL